MTTDERAAFEAHVLQTGALDFQWEGKWPCALFDRNLAWENIESRWIDYQAACAWQRRECEAIYRRMVDEAYTQDMVAAEIRGQG